MKRGLILSIIMGGVLGGLLLAPGLQANPATPFKVALVDFQRAINETEAGKKAERDWSTALEERKKKFEILKRELETMKTDFEKQRLVLTGKPLEDKKMALQGKLVEMEKTGMTYEQDLAKQKADSLQKIVGGLQTVVQQIGKKDGYDFIFEKSQGGVLFSSAATQDITTQVIQEFNKVIK